MFDDIEKTNRDRKAYDNLVYVLGKNYYNLERMSKQKREDLIEIIYHVFCGLNDKGEGYRKSIINPDDAKLFGDDYNSSFGNVMIDRDYESWIAVSYLNYFSHIRYTKYRKEDILSGVLSLNDKVVTTITGSKENGKSSRIEITTKDYVFKIKGLELPYLVGLLSSGVISEKRLRGKDNSKENIKELEEELLFEYPFLDRYDLSKFINKTMNENVDLHYYGINISNYVMEKSLDNFLDELEKGYVPGVEITKEELKGLKIGKSSIEKFKDYEVTDIFGSKVKLLNIPLYLQDTAWEERVECPFLDAISLVPDSDIDVFVVGLCYFANYCDDLGRVDGRNRMGTMIANRLRGKKLNIAIKSSVLGVPLSDYVNYRHDYYQDSDAILSEFYRNLGFDIDKQELREAPNYKDIDVWSFRELLPKTMVNRHKRY